MWYKGHLVKPVGKGKQPFWKVSFYDGEIRDDIKLSSRVVPVRFPDEGKGVRVRVEVRADESQKWRPGTMFELHPRMDYWAVLCDDKTWFENMEFPSSCVRLLFDDTEKGLKRSMESASPCEPPGESLWNSRKSHCNSRDGASSAESLGSPDTKSTSTHVQRVSPVGAQPAMSSVSSGSEPRAEPRDKHATPVVAAETIVQGHLVLYHEMVATIKGNCLEIKTLKKQLADANKKLLELNGFLGNTDDPAHG
jgi:hypothetical protein